MPVQSESYRTAFKVYCDAYKTGPEEPLFNRKRNAYNKPIDAHIERLANLGIIFPLPISPKTFRHSFAVNGLLHGIELKKVSDYLGHANIKETERDTQVTTSETHDRINLVNF